MKYRSTAMAIVTGVLLVGGVSACSSGGSPTPTTSPEPTVSATPNGVQDLPADQILEKTRAAASGASSVTVKADVPQEGQQVSFDLTVTNNGAQGTFTTSQVGELQLITTPDMTYIKGDDNFNKSYGGDAAVTLLSGKWLGVPSSDPQASSFSGFSDIKSFVESILQTDAKSFTKEGTKDIDGVPCVGIKGDEGTLWVATVGEPFPMSVTPPEGQQGSLTLSGWNAPVTITPPPAEEVVDISQLKNASPSPTETESP